ncbi:MAG: AgmX/PglI C-terminal domain-containing protein [Bdellovibrionota bacterium]
MGAKKHLLVEYTTAKKVSKKLKMEPASTPTTIGSARKADLRIVGQDISAYHAGIEYKNGDWYISDLASDSGTWSNKENIVSQKIESDMDIRIGDHDFKLKLIPAPHNLYSWEERRDLSADIQEVVVKSILTGKIIETHYLHKTETFRLSNGMGGYVEFKAPPTIAWQKKEALGFVVQQRLRARPRPLEVEEHQGRFDQKTQYIVSAAGFLMLLLAFYFFPKQPKMDMPKEMEKNKYARIIYDAKFVQEKKKQSQATKQIQQAQGGPAAKATAAPKAESQKTVKAISQIRSASLKNLLGRISVRANMNAIAVQGGGSKSAKNAPTSAFGGTAVNAQGFGDTKATGESYAIGGVGTEGKGGGGTGYKGLGKLSQGDIGQAATVGMLDEEADVSGGMDKDAIAEVIRSNIGQIRFCYERRLSAVPNLFGKVLVQFSIQDGGTVLLPKVANSTLSDSVVEGCILRRIASWKFPSPPAGTSVVVTYPFLFKSTQ